jgi:rRNA maturation RNase YbeY
MSPLELIFRNRQRTRAVDTGYLRALMRPLLESLPGLRRIELGVHLVGRAEITRLNRDFLQHAGATDVITFDHGEAGALDHMHGEMFVCVDEAVANARRYRTSWQKELVRYLVHGVLHLRGHEDATPAERRRMKRAEDVQLRRLQRRFVLRRLERRGKVRP